MQVSAYRHTPTFTGSGRLGRVIDDIKDQTDMTEHELTAGATAGAVTAGGSAATRRVLLKKGKILGEIGERLAKHTGRMNGFAASLLKSNNSIKKALGRTIIFTAPIIGGTLAVGIVGSQLVSSFKVIGKLVD